MEGSAEWVVKKLATKVTTKKSLDVHRGEEKHFSDLRKKLPQYTAEEIQRAVEAIRQLLEVRERCRDAGLINW